MNKEENKTISFSWKERELIPTARIGVMYCFKYCTVNVLNQ